MQVIVRTCLLPVSMQSVIGWMVPWLRAVNLHFLWPMNQFMVYFFFFGGFWKLIGIGTVRKFPSVSMIENCSKGIFSQLYLKAYGEYVGLGIYFSKLIHFLKFISYQSFVRMVIFLKSTQWIALKVDGKEVHRALTLSTALVMACWTSSSQLWLLIALVRLWFNAPVFFFFPCCDFQDVHISFPANHSQTIKFLFRLLFLVDLNQRSNGWEKWEGIFF